MLDVIWWGFMGFAVFAIVLLVLGAIARELHKKHAQVQEDLAYYQKNYLRRSGGSAGFGNYNIWSFDGGQNWYNVKFGENKQVLIEGPADPALLAHLKAWDDLTEHVRKNGPIDLTGVSLLQSAGFTVQPR